MEIPKKLKDEIWEYCRLNDITDIDAFILKSTQQGFNIEKYGTTPFKIGGEPEVIEKEVVKVITATTEVEIIKEIPIEIEVIKEVEKIVEVTVTDNELIDKLGIEKEHLNTKINELGKKIEGLEKTLEDEKQKVEELSNTDAGVIKSLKKEIENLKTEIELEKNRNYKQPKKEKPKKNERNFRFGNIINWAPKENEGDEDNKDIYGEN
jgi:hypothetical protein